jgi:hypothetical protein
MINAEVLNLAIGPLLRHRVRFVANSDFRASEPVG